MEHVCIISNLWDALSLFVVTNGKRECTSPFYMQISYQRDGVALYTQIIITDGNCDTP